MTSRATARDDVQQRILRDVERGTYPAGSRLPAERTLAARLGVSRVTLRAALASLADEGVLQSSAQRGWFVTRPVLGEPPSTLQSFSEMAAERGLVATAQVLARQARPATLDEATTLRVAPTTPVVEVTRLRGFGGRPICVDRTGVLRDRCPALVDAELDDASLYRLLEAAGVWVQRSAYTVHAAAAEDAVAALLDLSPGDPVLVGEEVAHDQHGAPVLLGHATYRGDAYRFRADLFRPRPADRQ
ncbi:MAG TPA: GntR family transcriptional regulator [Actinotalea sp.]|nr:GntR family transcriptional regulator [Actinotalea sp.]